MTLKIGQLNAKGSIAVMDQIKRYAEEEELDILCLQEPYVRGNKIISMPISAQVVTDGTHPKSAIIVFNKHITTTKIKQLCDEWTICVEIKVTSERYYIVSSYFQYRHEIDPYLHKISEICTLLGDEKLIITADANAKSVVWYSKENNEKGEKLLSTIMEHDLIVANQPGNPPTFRNTMGDESNIDVTLMSNKLRNYTYQWKVEDGATTSDHNIIRLNIKLCAEEEAAVEDMDEDELKYCVKKLNWGRIERLLRIPDVPQGCDVNHIAKTITSNIRNAIRLSISGGPQSTRRNKQTYKCKNEFWNNKLTQLRKTYRAQRKNYQKTIDPIYRRARLEAYRSSKRIFEEALKQAKEENWEKFVNSELSLNPWGMPYKITMGKVKSPTVLSTLIKEDGSLTNNWSDSVEYLMDKLLPDDNPADDSEYHTALRNDMELEYKTIAMAEPFTEEEVREQITTLKNNKAPGPDRIKSEIIQKLQNNLLTPLTQLFNECLKQQKFPDIWKESNLLILKKGDDKESVNPKSYRPICLINALGKLMEKLITKRLIEHEFKYGQSDCQYGFKKGKSTEDAINRLLEVIKVGEVNYKICIFVDIAGAFDNLWYPALFKHLRDINCPMNLYYTLIDYCKRRKVKYKCPGDDVVKTTTKGCPQGSVCGPVFWNLAIEPCLRRMNSIQETEGVIAYADDIAMVIGGNSRSEIELKAKQALKCLHEWCKQNKLQLSQEKTVYMLLKGKLQRNPTIRTDNITVKRVKTTKYLGVILDENLNFHEHIEHICNRSFKIMNKIITIGQRRFHLPLKVIHRYHDSILSAIMSYGSSVWGHRMNLVHEARVVNRVQRSILIRLSGAYSTVPQDGLLVTLGIQPLHLTVLKRAANYWLKKQQYTRAAEIIQEPVINRQEVAKAIKRRWQRDWNLSSTGRRVYNIFPSIEERIQLSYIKPNTGMIHFITGHGPYNSNLNRLGLKDNAMCTCWNDIGTPEHVIMSCIDTNICPIARERLLNKNTYEIMRDIDAYEICSFLTKKICKYIKMKFIEELRMNR